MIPKMLSRGDIAKRNTANARRRKPKAQRTIARGGLLRSLGGAGD